MLKNSVIISRGSLDQGFPLYNLNITQYTFSLLSNKSLSNELLNISLGCEHLKRQVTVLFPSPFPAPNRASASYT